MRSINIECISERCLNTINIVFYFSSFLDYTALYPYLEFHKVFDYQR